MKLLLLVLTFLFSLSVSTAQTFLQLDTKGSNKSVRFYEGEDLTFQLVGDENWYVETLEEIFPNEGVIKLTNRLIDVKSISKVRQFDRNALIQRLGTKFIVFAGSFAAISVFATLIDWELGPDTLVISGSALAIGVLLKVIFRKKKTHKIGKRKILRTLSLDFAKNMP